MQRRIFIVTGASGRLGTAFVAELQRQKERVVALVRRDAAIGDAETHVADLLKEGEVTRAISCIDLKGYQEIYLIHPVGKFKFERSVADVADHNEDGMDDMVYKTNVVTLKNTIKALLSARASGTRLNVCAFGSVSDRYDIPFWSSYTKSKNIIRNYLRELCRSENCSALMVNVSTVDTGNENDLRPNADKTYWLQPSEIIAKTMPELLLHSTYKEIDIIKEKPNFDPAYYLDHEAVLEKWKNEMNQKSANEANLTK